METQDVIILMDTGFPVPIPRNCIQSSLQQVRDRLGCEVSIGSGVKRANEPEDTYSTLLACFKKMKLGNENRVVLIPLGVHPVAPWDIRSAAWFAHLPIETKLFVGEPITSTTIGEWFSATKNPADAPSILLQPLDSLSEREVELLVASVFWANRAHGRRVQFQAGRDLISLHTAGGMNHEDDSARGAICLPWRSNAVEIRYSISASDGSDEESIIPDWLDQGVLANWIIEVYLEATRARPFPLVPQSEDRLDLEWKQLSELHRRLNLQLPSEYTGTQDSVSPNSMGSASLYRDSEGMVPWDRIWTSFCDLAMAGGPPHRGNLLESVDVEKVKESPEEYRAVVIELQRGIRLASGLETIESGALGWVGVQCESEAMAAWLLRAILVENVIARREGALLFLPAGPDFRVEKEIKNVITSVAKTVHYWKSHLRSHQPPKPL